MYETINKQALALGKQFTDNLIKAQSETLKTLEKVSSVQLKAIETQAAANADFFASKASKATDAESIRALWEEGADFSREAAEKAYTTHQNVLELLAQNAEKIGNLAREQYEAGNEALNASTKATKKSAK